MKGSSSKEASNKLHKVSEAFIYFPFPDFLVKSSKKIKISSYNKFKKFEGSLTEENNYLTLIILRNSSSPSFQSIFTIYLKQ